MIEFPPSPKDGETVVDRVDAENVVIWTYRESDNSWNAEEYGPGQSQTTRTDFVYLTQQVAGPAKYRMQLPKAEEHDWLPIPDDLYLSTQQELNELFVTFFQHINARVDPDRPAPEEEDVKE